MNTHTYSGPLRSIEQGGLNVFSKPFSGSASSRISDMVKYLRLSRIGLGSNNRATEALTSTQQKCTAFRKIGRVSSLTRRLVLVMAR